MPSVRIVNGTVSGAGGSIGSCTDIIVITGL